MIESVHSAPLKIRVLQGAGLVAFMTVFETVVRGDPQDWVNDSASWWWPAQVAPSAVSYTMQPTQGVFEAVPSRQLPMW